MLTPLLFDETLLADITAARDDGAHFHLWWLGQSGFLLKWRGRTALFDPYLSDSLTKKYAGTDKEHIRMTARCIAPDQLGFVDIVTSSHAHTDHFDVETLVPVAHAHQGPLPLVLPAANFELARERLAQADFQLHGMDADERVRLGEFEFIAVAAAHDTIERDALGRCHFLSYIVRFGPWTLYHSGDTRWYDALPHALSQHHPDLVLLPINGHDPARRVAGNLSGAEAAALAKECGASVVVPHHFEMFAFNTATPDEFVAECSRLAQTCAILRCGGRWSSRDLVPRNAD